MAVDGAKSRSLPYYLRPSMAILDGQFKVAIIQLGPGMTIIKSQLEVIAASFESKHGHLWWPTRGCTDIAEAKHESC